ncbi:hypothetical protein FA13DRAFT_1717054 [Coprinellus micaceus]|uniref:Uncharacterized protein n=1 Tax=Coprinellus micaceus TaxID=71717 RepID=A0A4Y7SHE7_COPMI|nr:hypothetical protein FA13DRAFT_1717054 [Coprinellus micaceus]
MVRLGDPYSMFTAGVAFLDQEGTSCVVLGGLRLPDTVFGTLCSCPMRGNIRRTWWFGIKSPPSSRVLSNKSSRIASSLMRIRRNMVLMSPSPNIAAWSAQREVTTSLAQTWLTIAATKWADLVRECIAADKCKACGKVRLPSLNGRGETTTEPEDLSRSSKPTKKSSKPTKEGATFPLFSTWQDLVDQARQGPSYVCPACGLKEHGLDGFVVHVRHSMAPCVGRTQYRALYKARDKPQSKRHKGNEVEGSSNVDPTTSLADFNMGALKLETHGENRHDKC